LLKLEIPNTSIASSGFRHTKQRASAGVMPKVEAVKRLPDEISGQLKLKWKPIDNAGLYEVEVRPLDAKEEPTGTIDEADIPTDEKWEAHSTRPASIVIIGLTPLIYYAVRIRAKGVKGFGSYSDILVVLII
jgi:hypothetical protein